MADYKPGEWVVVCFDSNEHSVQVLGGPAWGFYACTPVPGVDPYTCDDADSQAYGMPVSTRFELIADKFVLRRTEPPASRSNRASGGRCLARNCGEWNSYQDGDFVCYRCRSEGRRCA